VGGCDFSRRYTIANRSAADGCSVTEATMRAGLARAIAFCLPEMPTRRNPRRLG
jgi:hypothetical protein